jgi:chorismate dehydratase
MLAQSPLHKLRELYLDPHSRTSNGLARVLFRRHWLQPVLVHEDIENHGQYIKGPAAGIAIGDKAHTWRQQYRYVWDLAEAWQAWSGLPFVFAVWAYDASIVSDDTLARLMNAFEWAQYNRAEVADRWAPEFEMSAEQARNYLTQALDFEFDTAKQIALKLYLKELAPLEGKRYPGQIQLASELLQVRSL